MLKGTELAKISGIEAGDGLVVTLEEVDPAKPAERKAAINIATNAPPGDHEITLLVGDLRLKTGQKFFVQVPTSLSALNTSVVVLATGTSGEYGCTPTVDFGIKLKIPYQVLDQAGRAIKSAAMEPQETITNTNLTDKNYSGPTQEFYVPQDIGPQIRMSGTSKYTDMNGQFIDAPVGSCDDNPYTHTALQTIYIVVGQQALYTVRTQTNQESSSKVGHGEFTNGIDVQRRR